jgi:hypothetical protein
MNEQLKPPGAILEKLISARSEELARVQKLQSEASKAIEIRGKAQLATLKKTLPRDWIAVLDSVDKIHEDASVAAQTRLKKVSPTAAPLRPGPTNDPPIVPGTLGPFQPYYMVLYNGQMVVLNQGAPFNIEEGPVIPSVIGNGSGLYGVEAQDQKMVIDWWFQYSVAAAITYHHHAIIVPFYGKYTVVADDGFWTSKAAHLSLNLQVQGFQSSTGAIGTSNVFDVNEQNVDLTAGIPPTNSMIYDEVLDAGTAYLRVSAIYYAYARGSGSHAFFDLLNPYDAPVVPYLYIK